MQLGMIGLGKMGGNMTRRLLAGKHDVVVYDREEPHAESLVAAGARKATSMAAMAAAMEQPRVVWAMVPSGAPIQAVVEEASVVLTDGDIFVDGGNSHFPETLRRGELLGDRGISMIDVGTSGGVWGLDYGYSMMVGGEDAAVARLVPVLQTLAPERDRGWGHVGPPGAGHYAKMVHNGIEYGQMQAFAEGFHILSESRFDFDLHQVASIWSQGSVIRGWLLELIGRALEDDPDLKELEAWVPDSGEGRWTVQEAIDLNVPAPVITQALIARLRSRVRDSYADRLLSAMRHQFGGHEMRTKEE